MGLDMQFTPSTLNDGMYLRTASAIHHYIVETLAGLCSTSSLSH